MAANRKLLAEIQQVLKKVEEGVLVFDEVWEKVYSAPQQTLKEKYEADLKKEIKKLQRLRDQIKAWISSSEVKDKNGLVEARKTIESKMEQFKICEKDTKTKAFSKEGLAREAKLDPKEALKVEKVAWINECLEKLADIINSDEADKEKLVNAKGKAKNKDQIEKFDNRLLKHRWHETRLELIIKLIENDELDPALLEGIKDSLEYYLESAADDEGASNPEDEFDIYEDLQLDTIVPESELLGGKSSHAEPAAAAAAAAAAEETVPTSTKEEVVASAVSAAASAAPVSAVKIPVGAKGAAASTAKATPAAAPAVTATPTATAAATPSKAGAGGSAATAAAPVAGGKTAAAVVAASAAAPPSLAAAAKPSAASVAAGAAKPAAEKKSLASIVAAAAAAEDHSKDDHAAAPTAPAAVAPAPTPAPGLSWAKAAAIAGQGGSAAATPTAGDKTAPTAAAAAADKATPPPPVLVASQPTPAALPSMTPAPPSLVKPTTPAAPSTATPTTAATTAAPAAAAASTGAASVPPPPPLSSASSATVTPAPPALNPIPSAAAAIAGPSVTNTPLVGSASPALAGLATPTAAMPPPLQQKINPEMMLTLNMLKASMLLTPEGLEPEKAPSYTPRNFYQHSHPSYPSIPLFATHAENSAWFERLPMDTLFFVFYFQQGTYQQYLAAKQLKKHSWRFHKKYMTWFQRHEEPKIATEEYEEGTYVYFDYESGWCQRIKSEFKFEYAYLEDELNTSLDG